MRSIIKPGDQVKMGLTNSIECNSLKTLHMKVFSNTGPKSFLLKRFLCTNNFLIIQNRPKTTNMGEISLSLFSYKTAVKAKGLPQIENRIWLDKQRLIFLITIQIILAL